MSDDNKATPGSSDDKGTQPAAGDDNKAGTSLLDAADASKAGADDKKTPEGDTGTKSPEGDKGASGEGDKGKHPAWFYADGTPGKGEPPKWYKADKYKTVEAQAAAYPDLEKRLGAFTGAPKDGKYEFKVPDGISGELDTDHPLHKNLVEWCLNNQVSQERYQDLIGFLAEYEASQIPDMNELKVEIGDNADSRLSAVTNWAKANLDSNTMALLRESMTAKNAAVVFKVVEALVNKTRAPAVAKPGKDVQGGPTTKEQVDAMYAKPDPKNPAKRLFETDPNWRRQCEAATAKMLAG